MSEDKANNAEYTGKSVNYYKVLVEHPTSPGVSPYVAECNDIIEALGMNYAEGNILKAVWRKAAARNLGLAKRGYTDGVYDAEKCEFFGHREVVRETNARVRLRPLIPDNSHAHPLMSDDIRIVPLSQPDDML